MPSIASPMKKVRKRRGLTQLQLARFAGAHKVTMMTHVAGVLRLGVDLLEAPTNAPDGEGNRPPNSLAVR